ncbi:MAG TPA: M36 family metallopeptidase, partial [Kofleriaceae bacterium]|nr:M36 family metallopeptidase [Kofleriaceae bacterium]
LLRATNVAPAPAATATASAVTHLSRLAAAWGVHASALPALQGVGEVKAQGATIARIRQSIDGLPLDRGELRVMVRGNGELVATNGVLVGADTPHAAPRFPITDAAAVARAVEHNFKRPFPAAALAAKQLRADGSRTVGGTSGTIDVQLARAKQAWHYTGTMLIPVWVVEAYAGDVSSTNGDAFRTVVTADGGLVLSHRSLVADAAFNYRVFAETTGERHPFDGPIVDSTPHPTGTPNGQYPAYVAPTLVSIDGLNHPAGATAPDPWLVSTRTETLGNNVEAYTDFNAPTGLTFGDFRATLTGTRTFDRVYDLNTQALASQSQQMAAITSLFFNINWLHDFWYDHGFTEAAGNGQDSNYGRGGEDRDAVLAEAQDNALGGSRNNANMSTPADGLPPRMQVFLWTGKSDVKLTIQPANRTPAVGVASFGPSSFDANAPIVLADDGTAPVTDGCTPLTNNVTGKLVLVDRGACSFKTKALNIQTAGGVGMILANNAASTTPPGMGDDATITTPITIGSLSVIQTEGAQIKAELGASGASGVSHRFTGPELDGALDSTLIAHEFGHYLHHRLQDCNTTWCGAISEGWGDFDSLLLMARPGDNLDGAYPFSVYTTQSFSSDPAYYGIRRAPYSVNPAINSLSYRHMADGEPLPTGNFLVFGNNAEVHNAGEVWAETMWEVYVALQKAGTSFDTVRSTMANYVVAGLMMAPSDSTPDEMRDALLAVASDADRAVMMAAFARRGLGSCAVTPARDSSNFVGIVESNVVAGRAVTGAFAFDDSVKSCDDDHVLDAGETASLTLPISNRGHAALTDVTATVTSTTPGVTVSSAPVTIASFPAGATQAIHAEVKLDDTATGPIAGEFVVHITSTNGCNTSFNVTFQVRLNTDDVAASSATDTFDAVSVWTPTQSPQPTWTQLRRTPLDGYWHGVDNAAISDTSLVSPAMKVGTTAPFVVTFKHKYQFEYDGTAWDGAVIEYSTDDGATWADVTALGVTPGYTLALTSTSGNPLGGRQAYADKNPSNPATDDVTLNFGTQLAGMTVKLRFRIGSDAAFGAPGWEIDDLAASGLTNTPFPAQVGNRTSCAMPPPPGPDAGPPPGPDAGPQPPPDDLPSGCCDAGPIRSGNLALVFGVLALLIRRRRR